MTNQNDILDKHSMYSYPGEEILKNNFDIHDSNLLAQKEAEICASRLFVFNFVFNSENQEERIDELKEYFLSCKDVSPEMEKEYITVLNALDEIEKIITSIKMKSIFSFDMLSILNKYLLGELYPFAGDKRWEDTTKHNMTYCRASYIINELDRAFEYIRDNFNKTFDENIPSFLADTYNILHMVHPFREGNTRTLKMYMKIIMYKKNMQSENKYFIDYSKIPDNEMKDAIIISDYKVELGPLTKVFEKSLGMNTKKKGGI